MNCARNCGNLLNFVKVSLYIKNYWSHFDTVYIIMVVVVIRFIRLAHSKCKSLR